MRTNLHHLVEEAAAALPHSPALTYKDHTCNYSQLWDLVSAVGSGLTAVGLMPGDRMAVLLEKRVETVASVFGASAAGLVFVPVNPLLRPAQVAYILADCDVRVLVTSPERLELLRDELKACESLELVVLVPSSGADPGTARPPEAVPRGTLRDIGATFSTCTWSSLVHGGDSSSTTPPRRIDLDVAAIFYTSGSTGKPKGVVLSHRNLIVGAESVSHYLGNTRDDVILGALPLSFDAGFSQLTTAFHVGAHVVLVNYLLPQDVVRLCVRHGVTGLTGVPPLWIQLADLEWPPEAATSLRYFANTGGRLPKSTLEQLRRHFPQAAPYLMYGLTEAFRSTYLHPSEVDRRPGSIGRAIPNAEILVVRPDGSRCGPGEEGELVHRGGLVALGYWNDPERTTERFRPVPDAGSGRTTPEVAVWSGDTVVMDEDGYLYFVGRKDDMIKTSGYRVSPTEIEEVAYDSGLVRDCAALGVDHPRLGQRVVLVVTPAGPGLDTEALRAAMRRELPAYMVPDAIHVREELPRSPNGKFDRVLLRQEVSGL